MPKSKPAKDDAGDLRGQVYAMAGQLAELREANTRLQMRLDACLFAMVLMQRLVRQQREQDVLALAE